MSNNSSDNLDFASDIEMAYREAAIAEIRKTKKAPPGFDGESCTQCGDEIPKARLALDRWTCVSCQEALEHKFARR